MSTLRVSNIQNAATSSGGIAIDTSGHVTVDGVAMPSSGPLSNRNLIINGAMQVAQRGASSSGVTATGYYATDRYRFITQVGAWTISRSTEAPTGFSRSWKADCTTTASLTGAQALLIQQRIEAQHLQHLNYGTANAEQLTCSFWVRSNKTGVVTVEFYQDDDVRQISRTITIDSANTWEFKTVTIPGDITGVIDDDEGPGLDLIWWLDAGPDLKSGTLNTGGWASLTNANRVSSSNISLTDSTANEFYLTGVQLEVGSVATPFEHRSYGDELAKCLRYYWLQEVRNATNYGHFCLLASYATTADVRGFINFPVPMRQIPALSNSDINHFVHLGGPAITAFYIADGGASYYNTGLGVSLSSAQTGGYASILRAFNTNNAELRWDAEL